MRAPVLLSIVLLTACLADGNPPAAPTASLSSGQRTLVVGENLFETRVLDNGLVALAVADDDSTLSRSASASIFVVYAAGSRMEGALTTGLAHLTEHALYTGTERTGAGEHDATVSALGAESNAFTREDYTLFYDHLVPLSALDQVLAMEADRMRGIRFDTGPFLHEQQRLRDEEERTFTSAMAREALLDATLFRAHSYGAGMLDEQQHTLAPQLTLAQVRGFYDSWYQPRHAAVVVVGAVDPERALDAIEAAFGALAPGPPSPPLALEPVDLPGGQASFSSTLSAERVLHAWVGPAREETAGGPRDRITLLLLARMATEQTRDDEVTLEGGMSERVDRDIFRLAAVGPGAEEALSAWLEGVRTSGVDPAALGRAQEALGDRYSSMALRARPYFSLAATVAVDAALGTPSYGADWARLVASIEAADVDRAVRRWLSQERLWTVRFLPRTPAPGAVDLPDSAEGLLELAESADASGDFATAMAVYDKLLAGNPNRMNKVIYLYSLGDIKLRAGDLMGARDDLLTALDVVEYPAVRELYEVVEQRLADEPSTADEQPADDERPAAAGQLTADAAPSVAVEGSSEPELPASGKRVVASVGLAPTFAADANGVMAAIERWRGLPFLSDLVLEFVPESEAPEKLAGWYEPDTDRLVVVERDNQTFAKGTMLHEMVHALQDQHFDLSSVQLTASDDDAERALTGLIEGEAMLAVSEIMGYDFEAHATIPATGELDEERFAKVFHYGAGLRFVRALREAGGWSQVDRAYRHPPTASAQIDHPDRYLAGWEPRLPDSSALPDPSSWSLDEELPSGEYALSLLLSRSEATRGRAADIAARLAGDAHFVRPQAGGADDERVWLLRFHDELGAAAFLAAASELELKARGLGDSGTLVRVEEELAGE